VIFFLEKYLFNRYNLFTMLKLIVALLVLIPFEFTSAAALRFPGSPGEADRYLHNTWTTRDGLSDNKNLKS
jgi:hypothetical protein